ncbi:hypothetical protein [Pseudooceanicola sp. 200-1SW]|uniref:hypothetical protein n=1 Tax=Pseudooceanicola sp. 200-1SW TaxID=3425949 RepID=UPI003D7F640A
MFFEMIAVIVAGFAGAGLALILAKASGGRLPRWLIPVAAGAAMIAMAIFNEYDWYPRTVAGLPEGVEVVVTAEESALWRPWTLVAPFTSRFIAVDTQSLRALPGAGEGAAPLRVIDIFAFARWQPTRALRVAVDCAGGRRADIGPEVAITDQGLTGATFRPMGADDPVVAATCAL